MYSQDMRMIDGFEYFMVHQSCKLSQDSFLVCKFWDMRFAWLKTGWKLLICYLNHYLKKSPKRYDLVISGYIIVKFFVCGLHQLVYWYTFMSFIHIWKWILKPHEKKSEYSYSSDETMNYTNPVRYNTTYLVKSGVFPKSCERRSTFLFVHT